MRKLVIASVLLVTAACSTGPSSKPLTVAAMQDAQTALDSYQAALGLAQAAVVGSPALTAKLSALEAEAAPYVDAVQTATTTAETAPSLGALAAELLVEAAPYVTVARNK